MKIMCPACEYWDFGKEEIRSWTTCPNCDFPAKFIDWVVNMKVEIKSLEEENQRLHKKIKGMI